MSALVGDIAEWVWKRLRRTDIQDICVEAAANFYLVLAAAIPFEEFETTSDELALSNSTLTTDLSTLSINNIQNIRLTNGSSIRRLRKSDTRSYDAINFSTTPGVPSSYARWNKAIEVDKLPNSSLMTIRLRYWTLPLLSNTIADTPIPIPTPWLQLMRYETLYETYIALESFDKAGQLVAPLPMPRQNTPQTTRIFEYSPIPKLWNDLLKTVRQRENVDEDFSINPVVRRYTFS